MIERLDRRWAAIAMFGGLLLLVCGFASHAMWRVLPWERFALSLVLALFAAVAAWPLHRFARWSWASSLGAVWIAALIWFTGPWPAVAIAGLTAAAVAVGLSIVPSAMSARLAIAATVGLAVIAGIAGWTLTWPLHYRAVWWAIAIAAVLWQRRELRAVAFSTVTGWRLAVSTAPRWAAAAVALLGLASTACWIPTMQVDDLAYHLDLPSQLLRYAHYRPDPSHQVWAMAPWMGDVLQGLTTLMAGEHARGAVNGVWLLLSATSLWSASTSLGGRSFEQWACVALFASMPPLVWMAGGMQTELPAAAVLAALMAVIVSPSSGRLYPGAVLLGALFALKGVHVLSAVPLVLYAGWRHRAGLQWRQLIPGLIIVALIGGSSYWQSWQRTGNPVLPLFNEIFESPYYAAENYRDVRWNAGITPSIVWDLVFDTDRYVEAWDGGIGFSLIALSGAWLVALLHKSTRGIALALTLTLLLPLLPLQYVRYAYPGLALFVLIAVPHGSSRFGPRFRWVVTAICLLNLAFQANASWLHHSGALKRTIRSGGDATAVYPYYVPERELLEAIPEGDTGLVLATNPSRGYIAELGGRGRVVFDHDPALKAAREVAESDPTGDGWTRLFVEHRIRWALVTPASASPALNAGLAEHGTRVAVIGDAELWRTAPVAQELP